MDSLTASSSFSPPLPLCLPPSSPSALPNPPPASSSFLLLFPYPFSFSWRGRASGKEGRGRAGRGVAWGERSGRREKSALGLCQVYLEESTSSLPRFYLESTSSLPRAYLESISYFELNVYQGVTRVGTYVYRFPYYSLNELSFQRLWSV